MDLRRKNCPAPYFRNRILWFSRLNSHLCFSTVHLGPLLLKAPSSSLPSNMPSFSLSTSAASPCRHRRQIRSTTSCWSQTRRSELRYPLSRTSNPLPALTMAGLQGLWSPAGFILATSTLDSARSMRVLHSLGESTFSSTTANRPLYSGSGLEAQSTGDMVTGWASGGGLVRERKSSGMATSRDA